jgi:hypothetical protein
VDQVIQNVGTIMRKLLHTTAAVAALQARTQSKLNPDRDRRVVLLAIGQCLKDQYDALATTIPPHFATLVKQLETEK